MAYAPPSSRPVRSAGDARRTAGGSSARTTRSIGRPTPNPSPRGAGGFLAGLGVGLAVGAAMALLFAPQSGADTRRALRRRSHKVRTKAGDAWDDLRYELMRAKRALRRKRREARSVADAQPGDA